MSSSTVEKDAVIAALRGVIEPKSQRDVVSLGLVRPIALCAGVARITYQLPKEILSPDIQQQLVDQTRGVLKELEGINDVQIDFAVKPPTREAAGLPGVRHVLAVGAGKGGVGKSTVAAMLAVGLKQRGLSVGLLDGDVYGPSLPKITGTENMQPTADPESGMIQPPEFHGVKIMSMGHLVPPGQAVIWRGPMAQKYVQEFLDRGIWGDLDYLIVDLPPGTGDIPLTLAQSIPLTGAVIVCTPQDVALADATKAIGMYRKLSVEPLGMVENMSFFCCPECGHRQEIFGHGGARQAAEALHVPFLGELPLNMAIRVAGDEGRPLEIFKSATPHVTEACEQIVTRLLHEVAERAKKSTPLPQLKVH